MADKFSNEEIIEISNKLKWKPSDLSYYMLYLIIIAVIAIFLIIIYLILVNKELNCKFQKINNELNNLKSKSDDLKEGFKNNSNEIRYLVSTSGKKTDNSNLLERSGIMQPVFENEREDPLLYSSLDGK